jgi:hypothetical protein
MVSMNMDDCQEILDRAGHQESYVGRVVRHLHHKPARRLRKIATAAYHGTTFALAASPNHVVVNGQTKTWDEVDNM